MIDETFCAGDQSMNALALAQPDPEPSIKPFIDATVVRLADEGIPVRAIARATHRTSEEIYEALHEAIAQGLIVEMPRNDWPVGSLRSARLIFHGTPLEQEAALRCACARYFKATPLEAAMLALMLRRNEVTKQQLHLVIEQNRSTMGKETTDPKMVDVMICKLRKKLNLHKIAIETMWGMGYLISAPDRERVCELLTGSPPPVLQVA